MKKQKKRRSMKKRPSLSSRRDTVEHEEMLEALRAPEKYRMIFENSPLGIFRSTFEGRLLEVNAALAKIFGYDSPEIMIREVHDVAKQLYVRAEDRHRIVANQMAAADITHHLNHYRRKDGRELVANLYLRTVRDAHGQPTFLEGIVEDITERRRLEERLRSLYQYALGLASAKDLGEIVSHTLDTMQFNLGFDSAEFDMIEDGLVVVKGERGEIGLSVPRHLDDPGVIPKAARELRSIRVGDTRKEPSYVDHMGLDWKGPPTMLSELATPVIIAGQAVAVLNVEHTQVEAFSEQDQVLLENLAAHVASEINRKRIEDGLRRSEDRYHSLFQGMMEGLAYCKMIFDENGRPVDFVYIDVNSAFGQLTGLEDVVGKRVSEAIPGIKETNPELFEIYGRVASTGKPEKFEVDVKPLGISLNISVSSPAKGYFVAVFENITERMRADEKVRQSEERYRSLFDRMLDGTYCSTHEGRFVDVNPAFVKMFGYSSKEEMLAVTDIKKELYFSPEERGSHILDTGQEEVEVYRMRRKDGSEIWVEDHGGYVHDAQGNVIFHEGLLRDVTGRVRAERALSESEERYRLLIERQKEGLCLIDPEERFIMCNPMGEEIFGVSQGGIIGRSLREFTSPENFELARKQTNSRRTGEKSTYEFEIIRADGEKRQLLVTATPWLDKDGQYASTLVIFRDETDRKREQEQLQRQADQLAALQATVLDITTKRDLPGLLHTIIERAATLLKAPSGGLYTCDPERQMVRCVVSFNTPSDYTGTLLKFGEGAAGTVAITGQPLIIDDYRSWSARAGVFEADQPFGALLSVPMIWESQVIGVIHVLDKESRHFTESDLALLTVFANHAAIALKNARYSENLEELVSERTRELRESEEKYRELFEASPVSLWEEDFSQVKQFLEELRRKGISDFGAYFADHPKEVIKCAALVKVINMNKATLNLYNAKSVDDIIGGLSSVLTEESNRRQFSDEVVALAQGTNYYEGEMENRTLQGETKHCNVICAVVPGYEQSLAKVLVCIVDLTPQKKLEAQIVKSQRLAAIGETAAMVGHDLRNPLQGIAGASFNIRRHLRNAVDPSTKEMLAVIDNGVQYANEIINDLLEFSREMQLQLIPTTPKSIVRKTLADVQMPNNITIEDTTTDAPEILADEPKVKRLLTNLIQNAIDAMPEGGKLSISSMNAQKELSISIRDTGCGIPQEMVEKIWTPLHTTKAKGIGLGLPICRRIIEAHGGSISVESTVGRGTTFTLKLPIQSVQTGGEPF